MFHGNDERVDVESLASHGAAVARDRRGDVDVTTSPRSARGAILEHVQLWNAMDKDAWLALFADDVEYEDPPGTVASRGKQVMSDHAWDGSFTDTKRWILEPLLRDRVRQRGAGPHAQPRCGERRARLGRQHRALACQRRRPRRLRPRVLGDPDRDLRLARPQHLGASATDTPLLASPEPRYAPW